MDTPGAHGNPDLLGELYAGGACRWRCIRRASPVHLPQHQRQSGVAGHHPPHRHRGHCCFINADLIFRREDYPQTVSGTAESPPCRISPAGAEAASSAFGHEASRHRVGQEAIIYADLDMQKILAA